MNEFKGTPGPWLRDCGTVFALNAERFPVNRFTAQLDRGFGDDGKRITNEEIIHNAALITAAPDLLEDLIITLGNLKEVCDVMGCPRPNSTIRRAEAAIAKALGESK